jgi:DNA-binding LacI/PurR family transcriptional regulator
VVVWGGQLPQQLYCSVGGDNVDGGAQATAHLLRAGRQHIVFLGDAQLPEVWLRREGYLQAHKAVNLVPSAELEISVPFEVGAARQAMDLLCASGQAFDGVVACSDLLALQAIQSVRAYGLSVPTDVSVVGYDDMPLAAYCDPPLTTVHQPVVEAGAALVAALLRMLRGERALPRTLPVGLVVRASAP